MLRVSPFFSTLEGVQKGTIGGFSISSVVLLRLVRTYVSSKDACLFESRCLFVSALVFNKDV